VVRVKNEHGIKLKLEIGLQLAHAMIVLTKWEFLINQNVDVVDTADTNKNTYNNKQKVNDQNINKETEANLLVDRKVCKRNDIDILAGDFDVVQYDKNPYCGQVIDINKTTTLYELIL